MSSSLLVYAYVAGKNIPLFHLNAWIWAVNAPSPPAEHREMAALLFTSSVCVGLLLTLLAVSVRVTCRGRQRRNGGLKPVSRTVRFQEEKDDKDDGEGADSRLIPAAGQKDLCRWEEVTYMSEAAERAERIERRDMIIQEIWMNAYLNGSSSKLWAVATAQLGFALLNATFCNYRVQKSHHHCYGFIVMLRSFFFFSKCIHFFSPLNYTHPIMTIW